MHDPFFVRGFQGLGDLPGVGHGRFGREWAFDRLARNQLHHERSHAAGLFNSVDLRHVGMVEHGQGARFALEPGKAIGVLGEGIGQHLDRDQAVELGVTRLVHLAHPAGANGGEDLVGAEFGACGQGHKI